MEIKFQTDVGRKRTNNQDAVGVFSNKKEIKLALIADGMGGHQAGDVASTLTVSDLGKQWEQTELSELEAIVQWLLENIQQQNEKIFEKGQVNPDQSGMGTTIVAVVILEETAIVTHVGDSRAYLVRNQEIKQLTEDHSLVNELVKNGEITEEMAVLHPRKNVLVRSLGIPGIVEIDVTSFELVQDDQLLLCSDGLSNMLSDDTMLSITMQSEDLSEVVDKLIFEANQAGGKDNISVLLIRFDRKVGEQING